MPEEGVTQSCEPGKEDPDQAETGGTGPDVTGKTEDGVPAITVAWVPREAEPAEGEGSSLEDGPKQDEDEVSSSP